MHIQCIDAILTISSRAILHDEKAYPEPETFRPERFLKEDGTINPGVPDPTTSFGFGRRFVVSFLCVEFSLIGT